MCPTTTSKQCRHRLFQTRSWQRFLFVQLALTALGCARRMGWRLPLSSSTLSMVSCVFSKPLRTFKSGSHMTCPCEMPPACKLWSCGDVCLTRHRNVCARLVTNPRRRGTFLTDSSAMMCRQGIYGQTRMQHTIFFTCVFRLISHSRKYVAWSRNAVWQPSDMTLLIIPGPATSKQ